MKRIALLGSTGSIGKNTLRVAKHLGFSVQVTALAAGSNDDLLFQQIQQFRPELVALADEEAARRLQSRLPNQRILAGKDGVEELAATCQADLVVSAITGYAGLRPTLAAICSGKDVALANKESLVAGGKLVTEAAKRHNTRLLPVDSEHSAIFQCLQGQSKDRLGRLILTASGGPFRKRRKEDLEAITVEDALKHPTWDMGAKITVDSSTLMNKGLEVIEAHWLFSTPADQIHVVVHPQSIIHSMVEFVDHSIIAQMGRPDMATPIQFALTYPDRLPGDQKHFDFMEYPQLEFFAPDLERFSCLRLAFESIRVGQSMPCFLNAANEILVNRFISNRIRWVDIARKLEALLEQHPPRSVDTLEDVMSVDLEARRLAEAA